LDVIVIPIMKSLQDEFFDEPEFGSVSLDELDVDGSWDKSDDPEDWTSVRARTQSRNVMLYNEGIYKVIRSKTAKPLTEDVDVMSEDEILDKMPRTLKENHVVPSPSGEYITVIEVTGREQSDGTIELDTTGRTNTIPVEFVKEGLTYDEVVVELLDV